MMTHHQAPNYVILRFKVGNFVVILLSVLPLFAEACQETVTTCHLTMRCSAQRVHYPLV